ncbi:MAG TPA: phosphatidate cytidylyltransferase [Geminicoccus sp.]|uniref:phosphatidate cytidylyltransferase n=1 Tax=Geminicoccus sp. TaxID=2024832 RepID=UPI002E31BD8F|nr:phosphatidate cytidylyltransferase [Geminicoccus sp.]HEX2527661.1 phosphatidate cytidylyltransferase [Geminicoccus sp.]
MTREFDPAFYKRLTSGLALVVIAMAGLWFGGWAFDVLVVAAAGFMAYEYGRIAGRLGGGTGFNYLTIVATGLATLLGVAALLLGTVDLALAVVALVALATVALAALFGRNDGDRAAFGPLYIAVPCVLIIDLRLGEPRGFTMVLWMFAVIWSTDTVAYLVGRSVGGPKVAPAISPGKTWSGCLGGAIGGVLAGALVATLANGMPLAAAFAALFVSIAGQLGDLFESRLKRVAGLKDSGRVIPGHGGVLDRLDAVLFAAPVTSLLVYAFGPGVLT